MSLASRGQRDLDGGPEEITDDAERTQVRRQARRVHVRSVALAAALVAVVLVLPPWR